MVGSDQQVPFWWHQQKGQEKEDDLMVMHVFRVSTSGPGSLRGLVICPAKKRRKRRWTRLVRYGIQKTEGRHHGGT